MKKYNEDILVFPTEVIRPIWFDGFSPDPMPYLKAIFAPGVTSFLDRNLAEDDPSFKQIIPYVTIKCGDRYLAVQRSKTGGEGRLYGKRTISVGGHINTDDVGGKTDGDSFLVFQRGLLREIEEELDFHGATIPEWVLTGVINTCDGGVGEVHFGVAYTIEVKNESDVSVKDESLVNHRWLTRRELFDEIPEYEAWSQLVIINLE